MVNATNAAADIQMEVVTWTNVTYTGTIMITVYVMLGYNRGLLQHCYGGSSYSLDGGATWINIDIVDHSTVAFF